MLFVLFLPLLAAPPVRPGAQTSDWETARPIILPEISAPGLVYLPLDEAALAVESLAEYRIMLNGRTAVPYRMVLEQGETQARTLEGRVLSKGTLDKKKAQILLDFRREAHLANRLDLVLKGDNFRCLAEVEQSNDQRTWWLLEDEEIIYRHEGRFEDISISLPPHDKRFLRITLSLIQGKLPEIEGVRVISEFTIPRQLVEVPAKMRLRQDKRNQRTLLDFDIGRLSRDLAEAEFSIEEAAFDRPVEVKAAWSEYDFFSVGGGDLRRLKADEKVILPLQVPQAQRLQIIIYNGDDAPLTISKVTLKRLRRGLVFSADPQAKYELWYGRPEAEQPDYEIQRLPMETAIASLPAASLGRAARLPAKPSPPPPWSEKHPALFWVTLALVLLLLGLLVLRSMRGVKPEPGRRA
jgi:hypothetical protein